jgi:predicted nucleic acid-binding protein
VAHGPPQATLGGLPSTSVFIYQLEANPRYVAVTDRIFAWLIQPCRDSGEHRVAEFYALLTTYSNLDWIAPDLEVADIAARIRATHRLRTPDALQAATAIRAQATGLVTNDPVFERVAAFETLVLDHLL